MISFKLTDFGKPLERVEEKDPTPKNKEVLLEVLACGICHSDLHLKEGYYRLGPEEKLFVKDRGVRLPLTPGHEIVGRVLSVGPEANGTIRIGETKLIYPWIGCGECEECKSENSHLCSLPRSLGIYRDGGYSDRILVPDDQWLLDTGSLTPEVACSYACAGLTAYGALKKALPLTDRDHMLIIGAGGLGLFAAQLLPSLTKASVIFMDLDQEKLLALEEMGFRTVHSSDGTTTEKIREISGQAGVGAVVDFVNNTSTSALGFSLLKKNGRLISVGLFGGEIRIPAPLISLRNITVRGSYTGSLSELKELLKLVTEKNLEPVPIRRLGLEGANLGLDLLSSGKALGRTVLVPRRNPD